jgi:SAM-dependent methyltransferase
MKTDNPYSAKDRRFNRFRKENPDVSFAKYSMDLVIKGMNEGWVNPDSALAIAQMNPEKFWKSAEPKAQKWFKTMALKPRHKVVEYGCGSLRLGAHFISYLDRGHYFGLDVIGDFYEQGAQTIGAKLIDAKKPTLRVIAEEAVAEATSFAADVVFSNTVAVHVHPDETQTYYGNLARLAAKPGARLIFNAMIFERCHRFQFNSWAWPMEFYKDSLDALECVRAEIGRARLQDGVEMKLAEFEFRRPG